MLPLFRAPAHRPSPLFPSTTLFRSGVGVAVYVASLLLIPKDDATPPGGNRTLTVLGAIVLLLIAAPLLLGGQDPAAEEQRGGDRKSTRLNSSHTVISYAVFCLKKKR